MTVTLIATGHGLHRLPRKGPEDAVQLPGHDMTALAMNAGVSWAIADGETLWRSGARGSWERNISVEELRANCLCPTPSGLLVGTSEAHLIRLADDELQPIGSFDRAEGRKEWYTPWGGPPDVRSISRGDDGTIYANVHVGGIVRSRDDGDSWEPTIDIHADVHQVLAPAGQPGLVLAACARGLARSVDAGDTWGFETDGLHAPYCRAVAVGDDTLYLSASRSHRGNEAALFRRPLEDGRFEKCSDGLPEWFSSNINTACVAATGSEVAFGTEDGSVFLSRDSGRTWEEWASDLPPVRCVAFA
jgi:hypothetical protein